MELVPALWNNKNEEVVSKLLDFTSNHAPFTKDQPVTPQRDIRLREREEMSSFSLYILAGGVMMSYAT
jgi:hypothetical protein